MGADVDKGVDALRAQPEVEGNVGMARGARQVVIAVAACRDLAAFGLQGDQGFAAQQGGEVEVSGVAQQVGGGIAPGPGQIGLQGGGEGCQRRTVRGKWPAHAVAAKPLRQIGPGCGSVACARQPGQNRLGRGDGVQPDSMGAVETLAGIGGQDQRQPAVGGGGLGKAVPAGDPRDHCRDPPRIGAVGEAGKLQVGVAGTRGFETGDAGKDAAVNLGQDDVHGEVSGREAAGRGAPIAAAGGGQGDLEHRAAGDVERGGAIRRPR